MTIRRPRTPIPTLRHAVFFEALTGRAPYTAEARALSATLLTLRLADEWQRSGAVVVDDGARGLDATRQAIDVCEDHALQLALREVVEAMCSVREPDAYALAVRLEAVASTWEARHQPQLAAAIRGHASGASEAMRTVRA